MKLHQRQKLDRAVMQFAADLAQNPLIGFTRFQTIPLTPVASAAVAYK